MLRRLKIELVKVIPLTHTRKEAAHEVIDSDLFITERIIKGARTTERTPQHKSFRKINYAVAELFRQVADRKRSGYTIIDDSVRIWQ